MSVKIPKNLRDALLAIPGTTAIAMNINHGPAIVIKAMLGDAVSMLKKGIIIKFEPQLILYDSGAIFRLYIEFRDQARSPMRMDTFLNPINPYDRDLLYLFTQTPTLAFYILDTQLRPQGAKQINFNERTRASMANMIEQAITYNTNVVHYNYAASLAQAKEEFPL